MSIALNPQAKQVLDLMAASGQPTMDQMSPQDARLAFSAGLKMLQSQPAPVAEVRDLKVPGPAGDIPVRYYRPQGSSADTALPVCVYFHGGGFVIGDLDGYESICRRLANSAGCAVVSVDYRLSPEARFPAAVDDCFAAAKWVSDNATSLKIDPSKLAVAGDSAGGNLATVVSLMARDAGGPKIAYQLLIYPVADMQGDTESARRNADGYFLTGNLMGYFLGHYLGDTPEAAADWRASPLRAPSLAGLPSASVLVCGFDPLRDDGANYAEALKKAGVPVTFTELPDQIHGLFSLDGAIPAAGPALDQLAAELKAGLA
jgi:acetyl esterase